MNKLFITIITLITLISMILTIELNTNYTVIKSYESLKFKSGSLMICSHNYEHKDIFIVLKELSKINQNFIVLFANKIWNNLLEIARPKNVEFTYVKDNTVNKISSKLLLGHNVVMFLYKETTSSGPFYILKNTQAPLIILRIKGKTAGINHFNGNALDIYIANSSNSYNIEYIKFKYYINKSINKSCLFMKKLIKHIYN